ncbi:3-phenylpropionate/trans-cinnamate dioxygenase ferredoxin reductase subunit [Halorientalis persicus]|jgi:ferredoxin-NADP reductase|uniref:3-phenylpropionate/trans-cinnamate dioxygenase ferredoxin reductase subunit n=1 Tax=Halorientalis persicus TaxID=1367881 RepID=A0A1H8T7E9_9EURY|nr:FAD-dependent oxidoreductase [Halorientalis persicus]SEO86393.1 3-phenylpropionate/trans-cinnamate dioxygenase ferredoxin reductase subunit [Halorientalis persicus]
MEDEPLSVATVESVGQDAIAIAFESPADFAARPGQFVKLVADVDGERESRFYTISSSDVEDTFEVTVEIDPDGAFGPILADLEAGDELVVSGPYGNAYYEDEPRVVVLAGGPGVGPAVGIARRALADGNEAAIVYRDDDPIHEDALADLEAEGATVHVIDAGDDMVATTTDVVTGEAGEQVFVYGFADFLDAATAAIDAAGGDPDAAKVENFG